ncbi:N-acetylneuraminate synthase family protein [Alteribacter populi]|uniref:N-acetylneuraminate synthase family protein n=1 Tax=Alteribacter populi TaxID=2011011 RepID=UPI000BBAB4D4|nr:N-acetylneuraminate synthase family protein [Alteribacter populi]
MTFKMGGKLISEAEPMLIIAEIGVNHNGSMALAKKMITLAKQAGADAVKFQTYQTESLVTADSELVDYQKKSNVTSQKEMLEKYQLTQGDFTELKRFCEQTGISFISTPFDIKSAESLEKLGVDAYKVGSGDLTFYPLLAQLASYKKPLILSTGMATLEEVQATVDFLPKGQDFALLHCTSAYPAPFEDLHLRVIETFQHHFPCVIGYSDHSFGLEVPFAAASLGYKILEKHFTLDRTLEGPDHAASVEPEEFAEMVRGIRKIEAALGTTVKHLTPSEVETKQKVRRGIYAANDLPQGHIISTKDVTYLRPSHQMEACDYQQVLGKQLDVAKRKGDPLLWKDLRGVVGRDG